MFTQDAKSLNEPISEQVTVSACPRNRSHSH